MTGFTSIIGQSLAVSLVEQWVDRASSQPLLFYGPEGVGKKTLALEAAKRLNCKAKGCGECSVCRRISAGSHPDVRVVDLEFQALFRKEAVEKQQVLRIETIQAERKRLQQSAVEGGWKVSILDDAHKLTADAGNVLLKLLEEPPEKTAVFLLTPFRDRLLSTIVSRAQPIRFRTLNDDEMKQLLARQGVDDNTQVRLLELALGSPGRALHMNRAEQIEASKEAEDLWNSLATQPFSAWTHHETRGKTARTQRGDLEARLAHLLTPALRDLRAGRPEASRAVLAIQKALGRIRQNVQPSLVQDHLFLELSRLRHSSR